MTDLKLIELIAAGGDTAMIVVAWALWRLNSRVSTLEGRLLGTKLGGV